MDSEKPIPVVDITPVNKKERDYAPHFTIPLESRLSDEPSPSDERAKLADSSPGQSDSDTTATNDSDEFDWDEEEEEAKRKESTKAKRGRLLYIAFMKLSRPLRTLLIGALGVGIFITPLIVVQVRFRESPAKMQVHIWSLWLTIVWAAACVTFLVVDIIPRLIIALIVLFGGQVERLQIQIELTMAVAPWIKTVMDVSWAWISLSVIRTIYNPQQSYWVIINRIMQALFSASLILLVEKVFLHFVAINFHQKALADRLTENRLGLKALDRLSNAQPAPRKTPYVKQHRGHRSPGNSTDFFSRMGHHNRDATGTGTDTEKSPAATVSKKATKAQHQMRRRKAVASVIVDQLSGAIGQVALKDSKFNQGGEYGSLQSARRLARKLFSTLSDVHPPRSHLVVEDFEPYFRSTVEAHEAFALFDKDGNGDISKKEMREAVQRIYRERKALVASLKDAGSAVSKLDAVLLAVGLVAIIFICLLIFNKSDTVTSLVPLATVVLGFSFIFGNSAQTLFESLIFIFSTHVFDVGDLVLIDDQALFVREFGLFSTTFRRVDGQEIIAPNALLASSKLIHNLRRSNSMVETTNLMISYNTPLEVIEELRNRMTLYVNENNREWASCALNIDKMEYQNAIFLIVAMEHRPNWQDWGGRWARRTAFMRNLKTILEDLDIRYSMPVQPVILPHGMPTSNPPSPQMPQPRTDDLGNAGSFRASPMRAPGRSFKATDESAGFDGGM